MSIRTFCDICKEEITGENIGRTGYEISVGNVRAEVTVSRNGEFDSDLCLTCLMKILNSKPKRKYVKKGKAATNQAQTEITTSERAAEKSLLPKNLTIRVPYLGHDEYYVKIGGAEATGRTLKETVLIALGVDYHGELPSYLTDGEKETIKDILGEYEREKNNE